MAGTDESQLIGALERLRTTFRWKADGLDDAGLGRRAAKSSLTLGGLLKHLALVEDHMFTVKYDGAPLGPPWPEIDWDAGVQDGGRRPARDAVRAVGQRGRALAVAGRRRPGRGRRP